MIRKKKQLRSQGTNFRHRKIEVYFKKKTNIFVQKEKDTKDKYHWV